MKNRYGIKGLAAAISLAALLVLPACLKQDADSFRPIQLGAAVKEFVVEADGGIVNIPVYSNGAYHVEMISEGNDWLMLTLPQDASRNGYIRAECNFNSSFKRRAVFALCSDVDSRRDTLTFKQKGMQEAVISMDELSLQARGAGGDSTYVIHTNIPFSQIEQKIMYATEDGTGDWITSLEVKDAQSTRRELKISTTKNTDEENPRTAAVRLRFTDGWGESVSFTFNVIQRTAKEKIGTTVSMRDLKYIHVTSGKPIDKYIIVEGIVVSNNALRNSGENEQLTTSQIDYSGDARTIYLESFDGTQGICLMTATSSDNVTSQYDHVQVLLYNTMPVLYEDPERLVISGVRSGMIVGQTRGQASDVPVKNKYIRDLTDDDIYTYVRLQSVEIPVRKGALCPVNEGYTIASNSHRLSKYPRLIRDVNGDWMYMLTNTVCLYRNDGERLPYGSGYMSGVIVHERFPRFEWRNGADPAEMDEDPTLGRIGTYQLRHQNKSDIWAGMSDDFEDGFSGLIAEYRYWRPDKAAGVCLPTYGNNGYLTHTYQKKYTGSDAKDFTEETFNQHMQAEGSFDYLGPIGTSKNYLFGANWGNKNGLGIIIDPDKEYYSADLVDLVDRTGPRPQWCGPNAESPYANYGGGLNKMCLNWNNESMRGKGTLPNTCYTSFSANNWWDYDTGRPYAWLLKFSTRGISASGLSLQLATLNACQSWYVPRYWKVEWSTTDNQDDSNWTLVGEYTVPDISVWSNTLYSSIVGYKHINFALPADMLGKDNVYIRLVPASDVCSSGADYADAHLIDSSSDVHANTITYLAIRYNK